MNKFTRPKSALPPAAGKDYSRTRMKIGSFLARGAPIAELTDQAEVDQKFISWRRWVLVTLCLGYGSAYTCRLGLSVIRTETIEAGIFTATALGSIGLAFKVAYGFGKLFNQFLIKSLACGRQQDNVSRLLPKLLDFFYTANNRFDLNHHAGTTAKRPVIHTLVLVCCPPT